ncbi:MAG: alpha/beta hydrolase family protein [Actinomycetota bacterium]
MTWFRPGDVCRERPVAVIVHSHGWSGTRAWGFEWELMGGITVRRLLREGYGVVSIDARGHGESAGRAFFQHPEQEVRDYRAVLDWIYDYLPWVEREGNPRQKDIVAGGAGESYGGAFQLLTASFDPRLDAIVPVATWSDLNRSLAPGGVPRSAWLSYLYGVGKVHTNMDQRLDQWYGETMATNRVPGPAVTAFRESSPATWIKKIDIPTLLLQGLPDTLFDINEAVRTFRGIRRNSAPAWLIGMNTGHLIPGIQPTGWDAPSRSMRDQCADPVALTMRFYRAFLNGDREARGDMADVPRVILPTEQGQCVTGSNWPVSTKSVRVAIPTLAAPQASGSYVIPLLTAKGRTVIAGIPRLRATVPAELDDIFFVSLVTPQGQGFHVIDDQVTPIRTKVGRLDGGLEVELAGVATTLETGDQLLLRVDAVNEQFALNGSRRPGAVVLQDVTLRLPIASTLSRRVEAAR